MISRPFRSTLLYSETSACGWRRYRATPDHYGNDVGFHFLISRDLRVNILLGRYGLSRVIVVLGM